MGLLKTFRAVKDPGWNAWARGDDFAPGGGVRPAVTSDRALKLLTVYGCVAFIADTIAIQPADFNRDRAGVREQVGAPRWWEQPNPEHDAVALATQFVSSLLLRGNSYLLPVRSRRDGSVLEVWSVDPDSVTLDRHGARRGQWRIDGRPVSELIHVPAMVRSGETLGMDPITAAADAVGLGLDLSEYASTFFKSGSIPPGVIEAPGQLTEEAVDEMKRRWVSRNAGIAAAHTPGILAGGASFKPIQLSNEQSQFLESRNFTAAEIAASLYRVPPELVGLSLPNNQNITYQNIEQRWTDLVRRTFMPWIIRWERAVSRLSPIGTTMKLNLDSYLRADTKTRYETHEIAIRSGLANANERRELEDLEPYEGGDQYFQPSVGGSVGADEDEPAADTDEDDDAVGSRGDPDPPVVSDPAPAPPRKLRLLRDRTGRLSGMEAI